MLEQKLSSTNPKKKLNESGDGIYCGIITYDRNRIMGKQSRRNRQSSKVAEQKPQSVTLYLSNPFDAKIQKKLDLIKQYKPILTEPIGQEPNCGKDAAKYGCRVIRRNNAKLLIEMLEHNINILLNIKVGKIKDMDDIDLEIYDKDIELKIAHIKFLSHMHNNNLPKATKYYLKWKQYMSMKLDELMFGDCSDQCLHVRGKRINAGKDEAVRLFGELIQKDVKGYTAMWAVIFNAVIPE